MQLLYRARARHNQPDSEQRQRETRLFEECLRQQAELAWMFGERPSRIPELENFR